MRESNVIVNYRDRTLLCPTLPRILSRSDLFFEERPESRSNVKGGKKRFHEFGVGSFRRIGRSGYQMTRVYPWTFSRNEFFSDNSYINRFTSANNVFT